MVPVGQEPTAAPHTEPPSPDDSGNKNYQAVDCESSAKSSQTAFILTFFFGGGRAYYGYWGMFVAQLLLCLVLCFGQCCLSCVQRRDENNEKTLLVRLLGVLIIVCGLCWVAWIIADLVMIAQYSLLPSEGCVLRTM